VLRYGYQSAASQLVAHRDLYEAAFGRHDVSVDAGRLALPWTA
jgi:hypothetical protein